MEPIRTDEPLAPGAGSKPQDMDSVMLAGCTAFLIVAFFGYGLAVWPHLVYSDTAHLATLRRGVVLGAVPTAALGVIAARRGGLAGACGFVGGGLVSSVFLFLRLQQVFATAESQTGPTPDYTTAMLWLLPTAWFCGCLVLALVFGPRQQFRGLGAERNGADLK